MPCSSGVVVVGQGREPAAPVPVLRRVPGAWRRRGGHEAGHPGTPEAPAHSLPEEEELAPLADHGDVCLLPACPIVVGGPGGVLGRAQPHPRHIRWGCEEPGGPAAGDRGRQGPGE